MGLILIGAIIAAILSVLYSLQPIYPPSGLPVPSPTSSFWQSDPLYPDLVDRRSPALPREVDIAIIGSGITGAAVAWSILGLSTPHRVAVLEARQLCSGATGRNGGHIKISPHYELDYLVKAGSSLTRAAALVRFQLRHLGLLTGLCEAEGVAEAECREVETVDLYAEEEGFREAKGLVDLSRKYVPEVKIAVFNGEEARKKFDVNESVVGAISYRAGTLWPYRFVTAIWKRLLERFPHVLSIETGTPVKSIEVDETALSSTEKHVYPYKLVTPRGVIRARHVVHATNAFASHLIPGLRGKMVGKLGHMSAQQPGTLFPNLAGNRSWTVYFDSFFYYIMQRPSVDGASGELMVGFASDDRGDDMVGVYDDSTLDRHTYAHLEEIMPRIFAPKWGEDREGGRMKSIWSGVMALTGDDLPFVGNLDHRLTGRKLGVPPQLGALGRGHNGTGEWISTAYNGDGMVLAWLCGTALGIMIAGMEEVELQPDPGRPSGKLADWFPAELLATYERIQRINTTGW